MNNHPGIVLRLFAAGTALALVLASGMGLAQAAPATTATEDMSMLPYAEPGQRVDIGGRRINLRCSGSGSPAVILLSGASSWSHVWYRTQPQIAQRTRVCAFDRASFGFSDPAPQPQVLADTVSDLHAALQAAGVAAPYVLAGHSLGGLEARLFAQRWPAEVVGMVLLDTSPAAEFLIEADLPGYDEAEGFERLASRMLKCALLAAHGPLDPSSPDYPRCSLGPLPPGTPAALRRVWPGFFTADYAMARVSLLTSLFTHRYDSADHLRLGNMPLVVLSADVGKGWTGPQGEFWRAYRKQWFAMHRALAHLSSRGVHRIVEGSGHDIELDNPQAVVTAVDEVLRQLH